jgi:hypothetical protein
MQLTEKDYVNSYKGDRSMIDRWAEFLRLSKGYSRVGFEDGCAAGLSELGVSMADRFDIVRQKLLQFKNRRDWTLAAP